MSHRRQWDNETGKGMTWTFSKSKFHAPRLGLLFAFNTFNYLSFFFLGFSQTFQLLYFQWSLNGHCFKRKLSPYPHLCSKFSSLFSRSKAGSSLQIFQGCSNAKCFCRCAASEVSIAEVFYVDVFSSFFLLLSLAVIYFWWLKLSIILDT